MTTETEHPKLKELLPKIDALGAALVANDPKMPTHLKEIHTYLIQFEELAHLLSEEQIAVILSAQQKKLGIILADETKNNKGNSSKSKKSFSADEL